MSILQIYHAGARVFGRHSLQLTDNKHGATATKPVTDRFAAGEIVGGAASQFVEADKLSSSHGAACSRNLGIAVLTFALPRGVDQDNRVPRRPGVSRSPPRCRSRRVL